MRKLHTNTHVCSRRDKNTCCESKCSHQVISTDTGSVCAFLCPPAHSVLKLPNSGFWISKERQWPLAGGTVFRYVFMRQSERERERSGRSGALTDTFRDPTSLCGNEKLHSQLLNTKAASTVAAGWTGSWLHDCACVSICVCLSVWILLKGIHTSLKPGWRPKPSAFCTASVVEVWQLW